MKNKVIVKILVPQIDQEYDVYLPINKKIGDINIIIVKAIHELSGGIFPLLESCSLYNSLNGQKYESNVILYNTDIRNGTTLILLS